MLRIRSFQISLANKCRLLFGLAVLLIIAVTLLVPWYRMQGLVATHSFEQAKQMAKLALWQADLAGHDWHVGQGRVNEWWPAYARAAGLPMQAPRLIQLRDVPSGEEPELDGFLRESIAAMRSEGRRARTVVDENHRFERSGSGQLVRRYAMAVRGQGERYPRGVLLGVVSVTVPVPVEEVTQMDVNAVVIIVAGALAGLLAVFVFYLVTQKLILSPVRDLRAVAEQVSADQMDVRARITTGDEFEQLATAFNRMLTNLAASQKELRRINRSLDTRLGELAQTNVALFEANKLKSEFLANVSHELRTPLTSIIGFAELLKDAAQPRSKGERGRGDQRITRWVENILTSGRMLLDMINDLLDLAKIEAGKIELHRTQFLLRDVCEGLIDFVRPLADKKGLQLALRLADDVPRMHSDAGKIQQILYNLLSNAIKFTPEGGQVELSGRCEGSDCIRISVSDTGPGISKPLQQVIFEKFRQIDPSVTREHGGSGLGLPISRELARMLGGSIAVKSEPGHGSTFTVILPVESPEKAEMPLVALT